MSLNVWGQLGSGSRSLITKNSALRGRDEPSRPRALQTGERGRLGVRGRGAGVREPGRRKQPEEEEETQSATEDAGLHSGSPGHHLRLLHHAWGQQRAERPCSGR